MSLQLTIVTPAQIAYEGTADEVQAPGWTGEFGVKPDHAALLTLSRPGVVTIHEGGSQRRFLVGKGVAEAGPDRLTLLVDLCEDPAEIDKDAAKADLQAAQADLKTTAPGTPERQHVEDRIALAQARVSA